MRLYFEIARRGYRRYAAYSAATWAGVFTNIVFGFMRGSVLLALYEHRSEVGGYDASAALTYNWLVQALLATIALWGWRELAERVRSGDIAIDLARPLDPQLAGLASDLGRAAYQVIFRGLPPLLVGAALFDLVTPDSPLVVIAFLLSVALAVCVSYAVRFVTNMSAFWLVDSRGVLLLSTLAATLFSGCIVPVAFFPDWLAVVAYATPFPAMAQTPIDVFVGTIRGANVAGALVVQAAWLLALLGAGRLLFAAGVRRLVVQGG